MQCVQTGWKKNYHSSAAALGFGVEGEGVRGGERRGKIVGKAHDCNRCATTTATTIILLILLLLLLLLLLPLPLPLLSLPLLPLLLLLILLLLLLLLLLIMIIIMLATTSHCPNCMHSYYLKQLCHEFKEIYNIVQSDGGKKLD